MGTDGSKTRKVLQAYSSLLVDRSMLIAGAATITSYSFYCFSAHAALQFGTHKLGWTIPFLLIGFGRFLQLVQTSEDSPTEAMIRDPLFLINLVAWAVVVGGVIYG